MFRLLLTLVTAILLVVGMAACINIKIDGTASAEPETSPLVNIKSESAVFDIEVVATGLKVPWAMAFVADDTALVGERDLGKLHLLNISSGVLTPVAGLPEMFRSSKHSSGLFDIQLHPDFNQNKQVYLVYGVGTEEASGLAVARYTLDGTQLVDGEVLLETSPRVAGKWHFGGRLALQDGYLYLTTGDGYEFTDLAQSLTAHQGKVLRVKQNGDVPADNPFVNTKEALPEIWALGVRNPQGMAIHPQSGKVWINEHGPQGGDEINIIEYGNNYGWPVITYGEEYGGGPIGDGITHQSGMQQPHYYWTPSIAPSGMTFYTGNAFPNWQGNAFVGALALQHINRLVLDDDRIMHEERLLADRGWRVRFVEQGPDGYLYFGVDTGEIMRLVPAGN